MNHSLNPTISPALRSFRLSIVRLIFLSDLKASRFACGLTAFVWSFCLLFTQNTFSQPTYKIMGMVMPEAGWAVLMLTVALAQWWILLFRHSHEGVSVMVSGVNAATWIFVVISMYLSVFPPPAAISSELVIAWLSSWIYLRTGFDFEQAARAWIRREEAAWTRI